MYNAILVVTNYKNNTDIEYSKEELINLCKARNIEVSHVLTQQLQKIQASHYIGSGKVTEIQQAIKEYPTDLVVFNDELSGSQIRNLEEDLGCRVIDRTLLILDIFASRAKTKEAMLQVEIAQLEYMLPRLSSMRESLGRQQGGIGSRGPGEKKLELDRRRVERDITRLKNELKDLVVSRKIQRKNRSRSNIKKVAIVGYTNAGKSTLLNELLNHTLSNKDKEVFVKDMVFATLQTSTRAINLETNRSFVVTDTVGFVSDLPHDLVESFQSTLEEITEADLLLHIVDSSNVYHDKQIEVTNKTLEEIGVHDIPILYIYNKQDILNEPMNPTYFPNVMGSVMKKDDLTKIIKKIEELLFETHEKVTLLIPFTDGDIVNYLNNNTPIIFQEYANKGTLVTTLLSPEDKNKYSKYITKK